MNNIRTETESGDVSTEGAKCDLLNQRIVVPFEYPVYFTRGAFEEWNPVFEWVLAGEGRGCGAKALICIDDGLLRVTPGIVERIRGALSRVEGLECLAEPEIIPGGQAAKNGWAVPMRLLERSGRERLSRSSFVVAAGGGSMLDAVGLGVSLIHRGARLVRIPTTAIGQDDQGVGVKNGIDFAGTKNFAGTFSPPYAVINDLDFLTTLDDREWFGGIAEAFKVALIKDRDFFWFLLDHAAQLAKREMKSMEEVVERCAELHLQHIREGGDPFEFGSARPLDFGHWSGHRLEELSGYSIGHGQGVSIGMALDALYAERTGLLDSENARRFIVGLHSCGLPIWNSLLEQRAPTGTLEILSGLAKFREHLGGELTVTLPEGIGRGVEVHEIEGAVIEECVQALARLAGELEAR